MMSGRWNMKSQIIVIYAKRDDLENRMLLQQIFARVTDKRELNDTESL